MQLPSHLKVTPFEESIMVGNGKMDDLQVELKPI